MIRDLRMEDVERCLELGRAMHQESSFRDNDWDESKLWALVHQYDADKQHWCMLVSEVGDEIVGMFVGFAANHYFGNDLISSDLLLYVTPEKRGGTHGVKLIRAYEKWARSVGVREIQLGVSTGITTERTGQLYQALGFTDKSFIFKKRI